MTGRAESDNGEWEKSVVGETTPDEQEKELREFQEFQRYKQMKAQQELSGLDAGDSTPSSQGEPEPVPDTRTGHYLAIAVYALYLLAFFEPILAVGGFIISIIGWMNFKQYPATHFHSQRSTFLWGALFYFSAYAAMFVLQFMFGQMWLMNLGAGNLLGIGAATFGISAIGFVFSAALGVWWIYRSVFGLVRLQQRKTI